MSSNIVQEGGVGQVTPRTTMWGPKYMYFSLCQPVFGEFPIFFLVFCAKKVSDIGLFWPPCPQTFAKMGLMSSDIDLKIWDFGTFFMRHWAIFGQKTVKNVSDIYMYFLGSCDSTSMIWIQEGGSWGSCCWHGGPRWQ